ncbi:MAG: dihydroorotase, partial [Bacteroidota bacterium]
KNARIVNESQIFEGDVLIAGEYIERIAKTISASTAGEIINAEGNYLLPGIIDDQVHFREPGLTHKATIETESKAAIAGGITSFIEQPNTQPTTTTLERLKAKFSIAEATSYANYSFMFGGTNTNLEAVKRLGKNDCAGLKLFLGSSTGNMLVDDEMVLEKIFLNTPHVIAVHCEDEATVKSNLEKYKAIYGDDIPVEFHPAIRSGEACYLSSSKAIALAAKTGARLHVFHISTEKETQLFRNDIPLVEKRITAEVCIHHLWFTDKDYEKKGTLIKWNPAVKTTEDRTGLWQALLDDRIDIIATDHAPHTLAEKQQPYTKAPSGGPMVQHALVAMLAMYHKGEITLERIVEKMAHNPARLFQIEKRGFLREGYYADMVLVDVNSPWAVTNENIYYKCGWSPFEGTRFTSKITHTFVNGTIVYHRGKFSKERNVKQLAFNR